MTNATVDPPVLILLRFAPTFNVLHPICGFSRLLWVNNEAVPVSDLISGDRGVHRCGVVITEDARVFLPHAL